ncbi:flagellar biosynthetic protein FliR [Beijerinckia mobilis]|uniref:flagellar biosynthetic protein FliR n=1 Tax=Beijerinckia mobilis TaxID=231434 RepID=UPI0005553558|nr:flagellar biosynthetic protein FliR [Beijerinckia mobilis]
MIWTPSQSVMAVAILFCRIGFAVMLMPGFSSPRVPVKIRLALAVALTLILFPFLSELVQPALGDAKPLSFVYIMTSECLTGFFIGFSMRIFFFALETAGNALAMTIGLTSILTAGINEAEPLPALNTLVTLLATTLLFITNLHLEIIQGLIASYKMLPIMDIFNSQFNLVYVGDNLSRAFLLCLRLAGPFLVFSVIVNFTIGLINKMVPQIPIYFVAMPFVLMGGLFLFFSTAPQLLEVFITGFRTWLIKG